MKRNRLAFKFTLVSLILLLTIGCRQQAAKVPNIKQTAESPAQVVQAIKPQETTTEKPPQRKHHRLITCCREFLLKKRFAI